MSLLTQYEETLAARERRCRPQCDPTLWRDEPTPVVRNRQTWVRTVCGACGQWIGDRPLTGSEQEGIQLILNGPSYAKGIA